MKSSDVDQIDSIDSLSSNNVYIIHPPSDISAGTFTVKTPSPTTGQYVADVASTITFDLAYSVTGTVTPTAVKLYFSDATGSAKSSPEVTATGTNAPTSPGSAISIAGTYTDLSASLTLDSSNCALYTRLCISIELTQNDDVTTNNELCIDFGSTAALAGTKVCNGKWDRYKPIH